MTATASIPNDLLIRFRVLFSCVLIVRSLPLSYGELIRPPIDDRPARSIRSTSLCSREGPPKCGLWTHCPHDMVRSGTGGQCYAASSAVDFLRIRRGLLLRVRVSNCCDPTLSAATRSIARGLSANCGARSPVENIERTPHGVAAVSRRLVDGPVSGASGDASYEPKAQLRELETQPLGQVSACLRACSSRPQVVNALRYSVCRLRVICGIRV